MLCEFLLKGLSIVLKYQKIIDCLLSVTSNVFHFFAKNAEYPYIVWKESGEGSEVAADNQKLQCSISFDIDLYFKTVDYEFIKKLEKAFNTNRISFQLTDVEYDENSQFINYHYEVEI